MNLGNQDWDDFNTDKKIVSINRNGVFTEGKTLYLELDWELDIVLQSACQRLEIPTASRVFNADGVEIDDSMMIEDGDMLFLSDGDDFISPLEDEEEQDPESKDSTDNLPSSIGGYKVGDFLGRGSFGEVRVGEHPLNNEKVALKFINKKSIMTISAAERTMTEIQCLTALKHPGIISLYQHVETPNHVVLIFEVMFGGDLNEYLHRRGSSHAERALPEGVGRDVFVQIVNAVSYAHHQHICHRDLKLENILLAKTSLDEVKVADFGLSDFYRPGSTRKSNCGTLSFLAPEGFHNQANAGPPLDVWSLGVILFAMLSGRLPFDGDLKSSRRPREQVIRNKILKGQYRLDEHLGIEVKDLIRRMLKVNPGERASVPEVINHVWFKAPAADQWMSSRSRSGSAHASSEHVKSGSGEDEEQSSSPPAETTHRNHGENDQSEPSQKALSAGDVAGAPPPAAGKDALDVAAVTSTRSGGSGTPDMLLLAGMQPLPGLTRNESSGALKSAFSPLSLGETDTSKRDVQNPVVPTRDHIPEVSTEASTEASHSVHDGSRSPGAGKEGHGSHHGAGASVDRVDSFSSEKSEISTGIDSPSPQGIDTPVQHSFKLMPLRRANVSSVEEQDRRWGDGNNSSEGTPTATGSKSAAIAIQYGLLCGPSATEERDFNRPLAGFTAGAGGAPSTETGVTGAYVNHKDNTNVCSTATVGCSPQDRVDGRSVLERGGDALQAAMDQHEDERAHGSSGAFHAITRSGSATGTKSDTSGGSVVHHYSHSPLMTKVKSQGTPSSVGERASQRQGASPIPIPTSSNCGITFNPVATTEEGGTEPKVSPRGRSIGVAGSQIIGVSPS